MPELDETISLNRDDSPGTSIRQAQAELCAGDLALANAANERVTKPGDFEWIIGNLKKTFPV
jgi:hypothetical protein